MKLQNDINIPDGNNSSIICGITKEVLLAKADGVHKYARGTKAMQLQLSQHLFNCDDVEGGLNNTGKLVMVFVV